MRALIGQSAHGTTWDVGRTLEEFVIIGNHSPAARARGLRIRLVFYQHLAWFI